MKNESALIKNKEILDWLKEIKEEAEGWRTKRTKPEIRNSGIGEYFAH